jgi:carboxymethylenebutenolidase
MCFDHDSTPPIRPVSGASVDTRHLTLTASDGTTFDAFEATAAGSRGPAVLVLPDVRGLYPFYEQLAERFAERGYDSLAIDYFGRTAPRVADREEDFDFMSHVRETTFAGVSADAAVGVARLRGDDADRAVFTVGFCFGGSNSWHMATTGLGLAGAIGFYGHPDREFPPGAMPLTGKAGDIECPILGLMGGDDPGIPVELVDKFRDSLTAAGVAHELVVYEGAPHSFFDRKAEEFSSESEDAWRRVLEFIEANG